MPAQVLAPLTLIARDGRYLIRRSDDAYPLMVPVEQGYSQPAARLAVERLEHVARWLQVAQLDNKTSALPPDAVTMELYAVKDDGSLGERIDTTGGTVRLEYRQQDGKWIQPRFKLKLTNNSDRRLYCALLDLTETFAREDGRPLERRWRMARAQRPDRVRGLGLPGQADPGRHPKSACLPKASCRSETS